KLFRLRRAPRAARRQVERLRSFSGAEFWGKEQRLYSAPDRQPKAAVRAPQGRAVHADARRFRLASRAGPPYRTTSMTFAASRSRSRWIAGALLICALAWFAGLEYRGLFTPDEGRYADIAREMLDSNDWVTPRL